MCPQVSTIACPHDGAVMVDLLEGKAASKAASTAASTAASKAASTAVKQQAKAAKVKQRVVKKQQARPHDGALIVDSPRR